MSKDTKEIVLVSNDVADISETLPHLVEMISDAVAYQTKANPIYQKIHENVLAIFEKEDELANMEIKELIKLLDLTQKAQLAPVEQLTKLIQATSALYEQNEIQKKTKTLDTLIEKFGTYPITIDAKADEPSEDDNMVHLEDIL